jgi:hypothetical protein
MTVWDVFPPALPDVRVAAPPLLDRWEFFRPTALCPNTLERVKLSCSIRPPGAARPPVSPSKDGVRLFTTPCNPVGSLLVPDYVCHLQIVRRMKRCSDQSVDITWPRTA